MSLLCTQLTPEQPAPTKYLPSLHQKKEIQPSSRHPKQVVSTNHYQTRARHTSELETHPFSSQKQHKSNYDLPRGMADSSNHPAPGEWGPPPTTSCSLCPTVCKARASTQVLPGVAAGTTAPLSLCFRSSDPQDCYSHWAHALPSPHPSPPAPHKPYTYSQHLQSLCPADPSRSCKPFSHGRVSPERRKALTCLHFTPPDQAGREAAGLAQHSLEQTNSPKVELQLWACNQCFIQAHGRSLGPALMLPVAAGLCCLLNLGSPTVGPPGAEWQPAQS